MRTNLRNQISGVLFAAPWIIGFLVFTLTPLAVSLGMSFTNYSLLSANTRFVGLDNYVRLMTDPLIAHSLKVTFLYAVVSIPLQLLSALLLALLINRPLAGMRLFRTALYMPTIIPIVSSTLLWQQMLDVDFGLINYLLSRLGLAPVTWLNQTPSIIASITLIDLWRVGRTMMINLAGLISIPTQYYESAQIDGAGAFSRFIHITLPLLTPTIFLNLITGLIGAFKSFATVNVLTGGGPDNRSLFYMLYLYRNAFERYRLGYASAMSLLLFVIVAALTVVVFRSSRRWVYYEGEN